MPNALHVGPRRVQGGQPTGLDRFQDRDAFRCLQRSQRLRDCVQRSSACCSRARWVANITSFPLLGRSPKMYARKSTAGYALGGAV
jgi:hypothetical protein